MTAVLTPPTPTPGIMARPKGPKKVQLGTQITEETSASLEEFHFYSGIPITDIVEEALRSFLARQYHRGHWAEDLSPEEAEQELKRRRQSGE